jgi:uncharacterized protein YgfB (UPF0149 family)
MASLKQTTEQLTEALEGLVGQLRKELENGEVDFQKLVDLADQISERADGMAETFSSVNDALMQTIERVRGGEGGGGSSSGKKSKAAAGA